MLARLILLAVAVVASPGEPLAQVGPDTTKVATKTKVFNLQQSAATGVAPPIQAVTIQRQTKIDDLAQSNRLEADPATLETIRKLNPSVDFSKDLQRGQKINVPYWKDSNTRLSVSYDDFAKAQVAPKTAALDGRLNAAMQLSPKAFESPNAATEYRGALQNISQTVKQAESKAPQLSGKQLAYLDYQLRALDRKTAQLQQRATTAAPIKLAEAQELQNASGQIQYAMQEFPVVRLQALNAGRPVCNVRAYAIPIGALSDSDITVDYLYTLISTFSFNNKFASPTESTFPPNTKWAVWVDQDQLHREYAKRIKNGAAPPSSVFVATASPLGVQEVEIKSTANSFCPAGTAKK